MPDIFGKEQHEYRHIAAIEKAYGAGSYVRHQEGQIYKLRAQGWTDIGPHDFDALTQVRAADDAQVLGYLTNNLLAIQSVFDEVLYTDYRLDAFLAINNAVPEGVESYGVVVERRTGRAERVANRGNDAPVASVATGLETSPLHYYGLDAEYTVEAVRAAMRSGYPLSARAVEAAIKGHLETMEAVGLTGGDYSENGLLNWPTGTGADQVNLQTQAASMTFADLTASQIYQLITGDISWVIENSKETLGRNINTGMSVWLPGTQYDLLNSRFIGDDAERTIMRTLMEDNPWTHFTAQYGTASPLMVHRVLELDSALNPGSTTDRMVVGLKHERIAEMGVAFQPRVLTILNQGRNICVQVESKFSPVFFKRPNTVRYRDAI